MDDKFETEKIWDGVMGALKVAVSGITFSTLLRQTRLVEIKEVEDRMICEIMCNSAMIRDTLDQRFRGQIGEELERILGKPCEIKWSVGAKQTEEVDTVLPLFEERKVNKEAFKKAKLRQEYTFENYAVGGSNQIAFAAAQAVAKKPGVAYNPLFIYGGVGVGKTHLMQAIGHAVVEHDEEKVLFCTSEQFTNDLIESIRNKTTDKVRSKYRKVKVLLVDDVQFIAGKGSAQEEFFHTFNEILGDGGQLIVTADRAPAEIAKLEARLKSRFGAGLVVEISQPDLELRSAILLIKAKENGMELETGVARMVAEKIEGVRELQGFLTRLKSETGEKQKNLTADLVLRLLEVDRVTNGQARVLTSAEVISGIGNFYGVPVQLLKGERRTKNIARARQMAMYMLNIDGGVSLVEVGRILSRDHSTVIHARDKIRAELETNLRFKSEYNEIKKKLFTV